MTKGVSKTIENEAEEKNGGFFNILTDILRPILSRHLLPDKGVIRGGAGTIRAGFSQKEPRLDGVYSRNNLPKMKDGVSLISTNQ